MRRTLAISSVMLLLAAGAASASPIVGSSSGVFVNPTGPGTMVTTGVNTSTFTWGQAFDASGPSSLAFGGDSFSTTTETAFKLGTLTYANHQIVANTGADGVDLDLTLAFTTPSGVNQLFTFALALVNTPNTNDPNASADILTLPTLFSPQTFVIDSTTYQVHITGFENVTTGGGFITNGNELHVLEDHTASADLFGEVTSNVNPVPEPATIVLFGTAVAGLVRRRIRGAR